MNVLIFLIKNIPFVQNSKAIFKRPVIVVHPLTKKFMDKYECYIFKGKQEIKIGDEIVAAIDGNPRLAKSIQNIINDVIFGVKTPAKAAERLQTMLSPTK